MMEITNETRTKWTAGILKGYNKNEQTTYYPDCCGFITVDAFDICVRATAHANLRVESWQYAGPALWRGLLGTAGNSGADQLGRKRRVQRRSHPLRVGQPCQP